MYLQSEKNTWLKSKKEKLFITFVHKNHYHGMRITRRKMNKKWTFNVALYDPNYNHKLYPPVSDKMIQIIRKIFDVEYINTYQETCQVTKDGTDSFCATWSLILLVFPNFVPPRCIRQRLELILSIYKQLLSKKSSQNIYKAFIKTLSGTIFSPEVYTDELLNLDFNRFVRSLVGSTHMYTKLKQYYELNCN